MQTPSNVIDMQKKRFGRLEVASFSHIADGGHAHWKCLCDCGVELITSGASLRKGVTQSCGCLQRERCSEVHKIHGLSRHRLYQTWRDMNVRCYNPNYREFYYYGGRGIKVCKKWRVMILCNFMNGLFIMATLIS